MSSQPFLGIDFGTCNSSMAWFNPKTGQAEILLNAEGEDKTPSVIWFGPKEVLVGKYAEERIETAEGRKRVIAAAKRELAKRRVWMIAGRAVTPIDAAAEVLRKLKRDAEQLHFYQSVSRAVITHPAVFDEVEKDKLREAAKGAGFKEVELLAEPVAAALAYAAAGVKVGRHVLVYDLGGGTFDLALLVRDEDEGVFRLAMEPRGARLGGADFDQAIYDFFDVQTQNKFGKPICEDGRDLLLLRHCRKFKENLSLIESPVPFSWWMSGMGRLKLQMKRKLFEELIDKQVERTIQLTRSLWEDAILSLQQTESLILIGGSSRVPLIQRRLHEALAVEPRRWQKQDLAVTLGAAYYAQTLWGKSEQRGSVVEMVHPSTPDGTPLLPGLGIPFPDTIGELKFHHADDYEDSAHGGQPGLGIGLHFGDTPLLHASIYEYTRGRLNLATGIEAKAAIEEFLSSQSQVTAVVQHGLYKSVINATQQVITFPGEQPIDWLCALYYISQNADSEPLRLISAIHGDPDELWSESYLCLTVWQSQFIKVRFTSCLVQSSEAREKLFLAFLGTVSDLLTGRKSRESIHAEHQKAEGTRRARLELEYQEEKRHEQERVRTAIREGKLCPKCGFSYKWDGVYCRHCNYGNPLPAEHYPCPKCGFISIRDGITCPSCGSLCCVEGKGKRIDGGGQQSRKQSNRLRTPWSPTSILRCTPVSPRNLHKGRRLCGSRFHCRVKWTLHTPDQE
ncbi:MAG: Hsp70 family protein [Gemmataceae bacterium]